MARDPRDSRGKRLEITPRGDAGVQVLEVAGELDMDSSPRLLEAIRKALARPVALKIGLGRVTYVDSSGIAVLIQGYRLALTKSVEYVLLDPSPQVRAVIELSQLDDFFTFETTREDG